MSKSPLTEKSPLIENLNIQLGDIIEIESPDNNTLNKTSLSRSPIVIIFNIFSYKAKSFNEAVLYNITLVMVIVNKTVVVV